MSAIDDDSEVLSVAGDEWHAYQAAPDAGRLQSLLTTVPIEQRLVLIAKLEKLFQTRPDWRVAQHLALLHLDRFHPRADQRDLVLALYFAHQACELSQRSPWARMVMAQVSWERRLPLAVLHETNEILRSDLQLEAPERTQAHRIALRAEACELEGKALAYLGETNRAFERLVEAESLAGGLTLEALLQLMECAARRAPNVHDWAASRVPPDLKLGSFSAATLLQFHRRRLVCTLSARG